MLCSEDAFLDRLALSRTAALLRIPFLATLQTVQTSHSCSSWRRKKQITGGVSNPCFDSRRLGVCLALPLSDDLADLPCIGRLRFLSTSSSKSTLDPDPESEPSTVAYSDSDPEPDASLHSQGMSRFTKTRKTGRRLAASLLLAGGVHFVCTFAIHRGFCTPYGAWMRSRAS